MSGREPSKKFGECFTMQNRTRGRVLEDGAEQGPGPRLRAIAALHWTGNTRGKGKRERERIVVRVKQDPQTLVACPLLSLLVPREFPVLVFRSGNFWELFWWWSSDGLVELGTKRALQRCFCCTTQRSSKRGRQGYASSIPGWQRAQSKRGGCDLMPTNPVGVGKPVDGSL